MQVLLLEENIKFPLDIKTQGWAERKGERKLVKWSWSKTKGDIRTNTIKEERHWDSKTLYSFLGPAPRMESLVDLPPQSSFFIATHSLIRLPMWLVFADFTVFAVHLRGKRTAELNGAALLLQSTINKTRKDTNHDAYVMEVVSAVIGG